MKRDMTKTIKILTFLLLTMVGTGQAWADEPQPQQFGHITYNGTAANDGGTLTFYDNAKDAGLGQYAIAPNGDGPTDLSEIQIWNGVDVDNLGTGFFIMATPAVGHRLPVPDANGNVSFIHAEVVTSVQQAPLRRDAPDPTIEVGQTLPVKFYGYYSGLAPSDPATEYYGLYYVVMPADANLSVSITATFPEVATNATAIDYVDVDGTTKSKAAGTVYVLDGTEARLGYGSYNNRTEHETWYVLNKDLTYTNGLELYGKVHLILADGKTMSYDGTERFIYGCGTLDIYGQGGITEGAISAKTTAEECIYFTGDVTINGGNVSAESTNETSNSCYGIKSERTLTINRGTVSGQSNANGISGATIIIRDGIVSGIGTTGSGICANVSNTITITGGHVRGDGGKKGIHCDGGIIITGGQIEANGGTGEDCAGLNCEFGDIILGWTNADDYIKANSYHCGTAGKAVKTADGKALKFTDGNNIVKLIGDITDLDAIKNQKLTPYGIWGYCGTDDTETTDVDESKTLTWDIALKDEPTSATDLATTLTIEGCGTMASYTTEAPAPWSDKTIEAANILASADVANVNAIAENIPVTLGYTDPVATTHTFNGYFVRKTADNTNISANVLSHNDQTDAWTLTMPDYAVNVSPKLTRNTTVSVEVANANGITAGDDAQVIVTANPVTVEGENNVPDVSGIATISVTEEGSDIHRYYNVAIVDGTGSYYVTNMANASYTISAAFNANDQWSASQAAAPVELNVSKIATSLDISFVDNKSSIYVGETATVSITLDKSINAVVTLGVDDKEVYNVTNPAYYNVTVALVNGKGTYDISGLAAGTYYIGVVYSGDDKIKESTSNVLTLTVSKRETSVSVSTNSPVIAKEQVYD